MGTTGYYGQPVYSTVVTGEVSGSVTDKQLPNIPCALVKIKAAGDNAGNVYLAFDENATVADGTTDVTTGYPLDAGEESGWLPIDNLNKIFIICDNAGDDILYMALR